MSKYQFILEKYKNILFLNYLLNLADYEIVAPEMNLINDTFQIYSIIQKNDQKEFSAQIRRYDELNSSFQTDFLFFRDLYFMQYLEKSCISILDLVGFSPVDFKGSSSPVIVTEPALTQSLHDLLSKERGTISPNARWNFGKKMINIFGIASAMKELHKKDIIHGNLSPKSILLDDSLYPKLFDFSLSHFFKDISSNRLVGDFQYLAPEVIKKGEYCFESDVYAFSLIVYEILTNKKPFKDQSTQFVFKIHDLSDALAEIEGQVPECFVKLIKSCMLEDPESRPCFNAIAKLLLTPDFINNLKSKEEREEFINYAYLFKSTEKRLEQIKFISKFSFLSHIKSDDIYDNINIVENETGKYYSAEICKFPEKANSDEYMRKKELIKLISKFELPSILKCFGYYPINFSYEPFLTTINEYTKMSLKDILRKEQEMISPKEWNMTKKLITIYGIAAGMLYLHLNNIKHRNLTLDSILLDENYYPKISSFDYISKFHYYRYKAIYKELNSKHYQIKYIPKEFIMQDKYYNNSEVYSFSFILYEIITKEIPFKEFHSEDEIKNAILNGYRPKFHQIPECYKNLIEACWSEEISKRPSFSQIILELETNPEFISDDVDRNEFFKYIKSIEQSDIIYFEKFYKQLKKISKIFNDPYLIIGKISQNSYSKLYKIQNIKKKKIYVCNSFE